ncbi:MAG: adenosylmethionine--8-amino-7-oxononanoate transaminase [Planctomycetaceae bacterium]|nr:adenosylmethionine--8-amino-7-oxononanoate transaminase [Planctomycetaceae bacterium]
MPRTAIAAELAVWDLAHVWHGFTQMAEYEPLVIERAEGCWLTTADGRRLLDGVSSLWCNLHGHRHPVIDGAIEAQLEKVAHVTTLGMVGATAVEFSHRLADALPGDLNHVFYASDGAAAVEAALKMAFQYWRQCDSPQLGKTKYLAYGGAYHGDTLGSTAVGGVPAFHAMFAPLLCEVIRADAPDRRVPAGATPAESTAHHLVQLESVLAARHAEIAAVVIEPLVQGAAGMVMQPPGYLRGVRQLTQKYDVLLVADEIVTGFGRTGAMFACQHESVTPDILCLGKSITAGYLPMAAAVASDRVYGAFLGSHETGRTFFHGHTFSGNPLAAAAALASLDLLQSERMVEELVPQRAEQLATALAPVAASAHVAEVRQLGMLAAVELQDAATGRPLAAERRGGYHVCRESTQRGVWLRPLGDVVVVMPPLAASAQELAMVGEVLAASIAAVLGRE